MWPVASTHRCQAGLPPLPAMMPARLPHRAPQCAAANCASCSANHQRCTACTREGTEVFYLDATWQCKLVRGLAAPAGGCWEIMAPPADWSAAGLPSQALLDGHHSISQAPPNCVAANSRGTCLRCEDGHGLSNGRCAPCADPFCSECPTSPTVCTT